MEEKDKKRVVILKRPLVKQVADEGDQRHDRFESYDYCAFRNSMILQRIADESLPRDHAKRLIAPD